VTVAFLDRVRQGWSDVTDIADGFTPGRTTVMVSTSSPIAPRGWVGLVALGDSALALVPDEPTRQLITRLIVGIEPAQVPMLDWTSRGASAVLGPALLFFADGPLPPTRPTDLPVVTTSSTSAAVTALVSRASQDDAEEAAITQVSSELFVVFSADEVVAASGYTQWPGRIAHVSVLTDERHRRSGHARSVATVAINDAIGADLVPQWRASPAPSQRLARSLSLLDMGSQTSIKIDPP
jgi:hypothetical protein